MSEEENLPAKKSKIEPAPRLTFVQDPKKHTLAKTLKKLDKSTDEALDFLLEVMRDAEVPIKDRMTAAQYVVDKKISIATEINKENLSRMVAEARLVMASAPKVSIKDVEDEEERPRAVFDAKTILSCEKITHL